MKSTEEIVEFVGHRIGHIFHRPLMYGGTANGDELMLFNYLEIWSEIVGRRQDFLMTLSQAGSLPDFAETYRGNHPNASEEEAAQYVVGQLRKVADKLDVPIQYEQIEELGRA